MEKCESLLSTALDTVIVTFDLGEDILKSSPAQIAKVVSSPAVRKAIQSAVSEEGRRLMAEQRKGQAISNADGTQVLNSIKDKALDSATKVAVEGIKKTDEYKQLEAQLGKLKCSFDQTSMGVWINKNEKLLVIVGAIMAVGGVSYLYVARQGDKPVDWGLDLTKSHFKGKLAGSVEAGISDIKFVPSSRNVMVKGYTKGEFEGVAYKFDLRFASLEDKVVGTGAEASLTVPLGKDVNLSASAKGGADREETGRRFVGTYQLGLGLNVRNLGGQPGLNLNIQGTSRNDYKPLSGTGTRMTEHRIRVVGSWEFY